MVRIDDRGDDVAAEGGTDLIQEVLVLPTRLGILVVADFELRTVGRQTAVQRRRYARCEVAAHGRSAEERDLGLLLLDQPAHHGRMGQRAEWIEDPVIGHPHRIGTVFCQFLLDTRRGCGPGRRLRSSHRAVAASSRPLVSSSRLTSAILPPSISIYTNTLFISKVALTERVARDKFDHQ